MSGAFMIGGDGLGKGFKLLPPPKGHCIACGRKHARDEPHDAQSMHYQYWFYGKHGRWPTWKDAVFHCDDETKERLWRDWRLIRDRVRNLKSDKE